MSHIVHEHRSPLNARIEIETACLSVRNYHGDFFLKENSPFRSKNELLWTHCQESDCYRAFMWNMKLSNIGAK